MSDEEPGVGLFGHGLGPKVASHSRKRSLHVEPEGIAKYGHGLGPRRVPPRRPELGFTDEEIVPLTSEQLWPLTIALIAIGSLSIGIFALVQTIDRANCEADPLRRGSCDRSWSDSGGGGGGGGGGWSGHGASYGGFGGSGGYGGS